jgi:hypothetical protein
LAHNTKNPNLWRFSIIDVKKDWPLISIGGWSAFPLTHLSFGGEKGENFTQNIWDKSVVLLGTYWGTHEKQKILKKNPPPSSLEKNWALLFLC